jgi:exoribonuclease-2
MEYFWCLRWFSQEGISEPTATFIKEDLVRLDGVPVRMRIPGLPELENGDRIQLQIIRIDELMQELECRFVSVISRKTPPAEPADQPA